jgi:uncharacterized protein DUF3309
MPRRVLVIMIEEARSGAKWLAPLGTLFRLERLRPMNTILLIILVLLIIGALPTWPYSSGWGYYPSSGLGLVLVVLLVLVLMGRV